MTTFDDSGETAGMGTIWFPDGKVARTPEERVQAVEQRQRHKKAQEEINFLNNAKKRSPTGLAERRNSDGSIIRESGTIPILQQK